VAEQRDVLGVGGVVQVEVDGVRAASREAVIKVSSRTRSV
jgi:hypothetical protein